MKRFTLYGSPHSLLVRLSWEQAATAEPDPETSAPSNATTPERGIHEN